MTISSRRKRIKHREKAGFQVFASKRTCVCAPAPLRICLHLRIWHTRTYLPYLPYTCRAHTNWASNRQDHPSPPPLFFPATPLEVQSTLSPGATLSVLIWRWRGVRCALIVGFLRIPRECILFSPTSRGRCESVGSSLGLTRDGRITGPLERGERVCCAGSAAGCGLRPCWRGRRPRIPAGRDCGP